MMNLKSAGDDELVQQYLNGCEAAFEILVNRHKRKIYQAIYFIVRTKAIAEDLLQDTFIKILRSIKAGLYKDEGKFVPWALMVAKNVCLDYKRKTKHPKHFYYCVPMPEYFSKDTIATPCRISKYQLQQQVEFILNQLPQEQKQVIQFRHFEEMSFKEISAAMGTSVNTTIGRMRYGLKNLNKLIGDRRSAFQ